MKKAFLLLLITSVFLMLPVFMKRLTEGFRISKMAIDLSYHAEWEISEADSSLESILNQPFTFFGKGAQCYVFLSADKKTVLKLFRYDQPMNPLRSFIRKKILRKKERCKALSNAVRMMNAAKLAFEEAREETGLLYVHLNPTEGKLPILQCRDPLGRKRSIPLDSYRFVLQKKAEPFRETLQKAIQSGNPTEVKDKIDSFLQLLHQRTAKGISNSDPNLSRNFGFLDGRAVEFDFGNYSRRPSFCPDREIEGYTNRLRRWLKKNSPEWVSYLDDKKKA